MRGIAPGRAFGWAVRRSGTGDGPARSGRGKEAELGFGPSGKERRRRPRSARSVEDARPSGPVGGNGPTGQI